MEGQIHGGLTMGLAPAMYEEIVYDENGNNLTSSFIDYLLPTAVETPAWETAQDLYTFSPSPAGSQRSGRVGYCRGGRRPLPTP